MYKLYKYTYKKRFLNRLIKKEYIPSEKELEMVYRLSRDRSSEIRELVPPVVRQRYSPINEEILRHMTYDKDFFVRLNAVEFLHIGRTVESMKRLEALLSDEDYLMRFYTVYPHFSLWMNIDNYSQDSKDRYLEMIQKFYESEQDDLVRIAYDEEMYLAGDESKLNHLLETLDKEIGSIGYPVKTQVMNALETIRNLKNEKQINQELSSRLKLMDKDLYVKTRAEKLIASKVRPAILIIDQSNDWISQILQAYGNEETEFVFYTAGVVPKEHIYERAVEMTKKEYGFDLRRFEYPKLDSGTWVYDFIVPIGVTLEGERYSDKKVISLYENYETTYEEPEAVLREMFQSIYKERLGCQKVNDL